MRLPKESALSREQKEVIFAPTRGTVLVVGPPGSGKTVVAIHRERSLKKQKANVNSLVFNRVLSRYTDTDSTFYTWITAWWRESTGCSFPYRQEVDRKGAQRRCLDYVQARAEAKERHRQKLRARGHWGHLILDEAQDFPGSAHKLLCVAQQDIFKDLPEDKRPSLCILADENQRLMESNATIDEIRKSHLLTKEEEYLLRRNYRNTLEIAKAASHFYVGLASGKPELPTRRGDKPRLVATASLDDAVARITNYANLHENEEIGVLVFFDKTRKKLFNKLSFRLSNNRRVQTYTSEPNDPHHDSSSLIFDEPGTVTVLCYASSKGLEFDAVFLPELQQLPIDAGARDHARMNLYVMCSRARQTLWLMVTDPEKATPIWGLLPIGEDLDEESR